MMIPINIGIGRSNPIKLTDRFVGTPRDDEKLK